ncbi:hypothetical protein AMAG_11849 [Allomyces macrogynus ATCC 38327]|uniref:U1-type domain-containing protein n=1 Tax=Allomyces macrogynus (strain ATCC 38327) TaxID=578462 RepID=A0A0L0SXU5_ALLM3|nr:hypothetical protein AMAG_11849 [Allomyces macrogynus ATCC 38327]|eukprot:KNE67383.1 hypothetical protein AMAG_11849 [Allomyces macrogynus ATCC 38327]
MADYWRSKPKYWCKYCKIFVTDNKISRAHHESTGEHRRSMERFIAALAEADKEKKREEAAVREMVEIIEQQLTYCLLDRTPSPLSHKTSSGKAPTPPRLKPCLPPHPLRARRTGTIGKKKAARICGTDTRPVGR